MKLHSDILTTRDVRDACDFARGKGCDISVEVLHDVGSRSRRRGVVFYCEASSGRRRNGRQGYAARWDAYGWLIAELFRRDPNAIIGQYKNVVDFWHSCRGYHEYAVKRDKSLSIAFLDHIAEP